VLRIAHSQLVYQSSRFRTVELTSSTADPRSDSRGVSFTRIVVARERAFLRRRFRKKPIETATAGATFVDRAHPPASVKFVTASSAATYQVRCWRKCATVSVCAFARRKEADLGSLERDRPILLSKRPRAGSLAREVLTEVLHRVRLNGTLLYHYELGRPWRLTQDRIGDPVFHYLSAGAAILEFENSRTFDLSAGDVVLITDNRPHAFWSDHGQRLLTSSSRCSRSPYEKLICTQAASSYRPADFRAASMASIP
jgi:hypothetical protein